MKQVMMWALGLAAGVMPDTAFANRIRDVSLSAIGDDVVVAVSAEEAIEQPRIRSVRGQVKMWIPNIDEDTRLEIDGDGRAINRLRLRPGAADSALLQVEFTSSRRLQTKDITVEVRGEKAFMRVPKRLFPEWSTVRPKAVAAPAAPLPQALPAIAQAATDSPVSAHPAEKAQAPVASGTPLSSIQQSSSNMPSLAAMATAKGPLESSSEGGAGMGLSALLIAVAGAAAFLLLKKMQQQRAGGLSDLTDIQVLGVRRLGPRHQLILVRALGEDHLLSMNGERTERIASMPSSDSTLALPPEPKSLPSVATPEDHYRDLMAAAQSRTDRVSVSPEQERIPGTPFGGELLSFMNRRMNTSKPPPAERPSSPSIEGLLRLRREAS